MIISLVDILRYSPYDRNYDLRSVGCDEAFFVNNFRVILSSYNEELLEFRKALARNTSDYKPYILLSGYSGCGKTTLLYYLSHELSIVDGHLFSIINLTKKDAPSGKELQSLKAVLEDEVYNTLSNSLKPIEIIDSYYHLIHTYRKPGKKSDKSLKEDLNELLSIPASINSEDSKDGKIKIRDFVGRIDTTELLIYYLLDKIIMFEEYLLKKYTQDKIEESHETLVVCFDNMDEISLNALTVDFWNCLQDAKNAVDNIASRAGLFMKGSSDRFMTIILTLRESNISLHSSQWEDRFNPKFLKRRLILDGDVSEIMEKRAEYIRKNPSQFKSDTKEQLRSLINIFDTDKEWVRAQVLPLFNFDYRKFFEFMPSLLKRDSGAVNVINFDITYDEYLDIDRISKPISRGVMYSYLIEFAFRTYFNKFVIKPEDSCNKYRMLLTIMFNLAYPYGLPDNIIERNKKRPKEFTFKELLESTKHIFDENDVLKMTVDFFPVDESSYAHWIMIYNSNLHSLSNASILYNNVKEKATLELNEEENKFISLIEDSYIHFNASAFAYLRYIITHYEYFVYLVRNDKTKEGKKLRVAPLALLNKIVFVDIKRNNFEEKNVPIWEFEFCINLVLEYVKRKINSIEDYYTKEFLDIYPNEVDYCKSLNAFGENVTKKSFYITKLIFTHINYLDNFRHLIWFNKRINNELANEKQRVTLDSNPKISIPVKNKHQIQDFIISSIESYISLAENIKYRDRRNITVIKQMRDNIDQIRSQRNPSTDKYSFSAEESHSSMESWIWIRNNKIISD